MNIRDSFFDSNGMKQELCALLDLFELSHNNTLGGVVEATQKAWYEGEKFRFQIAEKHGDKKDAVMPLFAALGMVNSVMATGHQYVNAIVPGATVVAVRKRLRHLITEWENGVRFLHLELVASDRVLDAVRESEKELLSGADLPINGREAKTALPAMEADMMEWLCRYSGGHFPWQHKPRVTTTYGSAGRKITFDDTLVTFMNQRRPGGSCLLVSGQPFIQHQHMVARRRLPDHCPLDTVGYAASPTIPVSTYLDTLAKTLYELAVIR